MASIHWKIPGRTVRGDQGFTLLEVLISVVILTVALLGMAALSLGIMRGNDFSERITLAATLAQDSMEDVLRMGFAGTPSGTTITTEDYGEVTGFPEFKRVITIAPASTLIPNMKKVTVTVWWDKGGHKVELNTFIGR
ncbi:MAG: prepilin-type N-terminal cleavage/methylation domain-containing protein [Proteobacteria bacterium]|nr:prepilin-type N-terminal cleavage/methylation domain-containing protein [Pseudomonadota bacterium]